MSQLIPLRDWGGLDLVSNPVEASPNRAVSVRNVQKRKTNSILRRQGYELLADNGGNNGGFGAVLFRSRNSTTAVVTKERLIFGSKVFRLHNYTLTVTYGGAGQAVGEILCDTDTNTRVFNLYVDSTSVLSYDMGVGYDEASIKTVTNLITAINAVASFSAATTGGGSEPAASLPFTFPTQINTTWDIAVSVAEAVNQPSGASDPLSGLFSNRNNDEYENATTAQLNDVIYIGSKWDYLKKYDGTDCYRAGCPQAGTVTPTESGGGVLANGTYKYAAVIVQVDAQGNRIEGIESTTASVTTVAGHAVSVQVSNVLNTTGFNTDCAVVNGAQVGVTTITVDDGSGGNHTMKVGQTAYFLDGSSGTYVQRAITAKTNTTITISGAAVNVADNAVISNNLRIMILRSVASGSILKVNVEIPNNSFTANQTYTDSKADASLGADFTSPSLAGVEHGLPPMGGYLATYQQGLIISGILSNPDGFSFSSVDSPEYFPSDYSDYVPSNNNYAITGLTRGDRFFWIHKGDESFLVSGSLYLGQYTITQKGDAIGCLAHATIASAEGAVIWLGSGGVYQSTDGSVPERISDDILPIFDNGGRDSDLILQFKRAVAYYDRLQKYYILFIPTENEMGGEVYSTSNSITLAYDVRRGEWWQWDGLNMAGGASVDDYDVFWVERRYSTYSSTVAYNVYKRLNTNTNYDYVDHVVDIPWSYEPAGWIHGGQPVINKKFLYLIAYANDAEKNADYTLAVRVEKNFIKSVYQTSLDIELGAGSDAEGWGFGVWGFFAWGNPREGKIKRRRMKNGFSEAIRPVLSASGIYNEIVLSGLDFLVEAPFKVDINEARNG